MIYIYVYIFLTRKVRKIYNCTAKSLFACYFLTQIYISKLIVSCVLCELKFLLY